jgi:hypothetical protein
MEGRRRTMTNRFDRPKTGAGAGRWALLSLASAVAGCVTMRAVDEPDPNLMLVTHGTEDPGLEDASVAIGLDASPCAAEAPAPNFGVPVTCGGPPPPISGGTLIVTRDGSKAIASDPDRDLVYVVDVAQKARTFTIALQPGDEPGRLAEDGAGRVHVALRGSGALATIDPAAGTVTARRTACPAPRGVAWQASTDVVWVACATGELASLPAAGGAATTKVVQRDLRDVIVSGDSIAVTQFRSARLLRLGTDGSIARVDPMPSTIAFGSFQSHVAWRAVPGPGGTVVVVHQAESTESVSTKSSGGYGSCGGLGTLGGINGVLLGPASDAGVATFPPLILPLDAADGTDADVADAGTADAIAPSSDDASEAADASGAPAPSAFDARAPILPPPPFPPLGSSLVASVINVLASDGTTTATQQFAGVLPVDVAVGSDGTIAAVAAGSGTGLSAVANVFAFGANNQQIQHFVSGQATALAFDGKGDIVVQTREPAALWVVPSGASSGIDTSLQPIALSQISKRDTGHDIFHTHAGALIACASCHPEGGDDGHVWLLDENKRRTPSLRGTIEGTAPYHWPGDEPDFASIVSDVYVVRMSGVRLDADLTSALMTWVNAIPAPPAPTWVDGAAATAGKAIFERVDVGCASCHSGAKFTNNATVDIGTGGGFQVPPLVGVGSRTPLMHDGCAATIADRFGACATPEHGSIASLSTTDIANLTAYLETL